MVWGELISLPIWSFPVHEYGVSHNLFRSYLIYFISILQFSAYSSGTCFVRFAYISCIFLAIINIMFSFLIFASNLFIAGNRNTIGFCVLTLYPATSWFYVDSHAICEYGQFYLFPFQYGCAILYFFIAWLEWRCLIE